MLFKAGAFRSGRSQLAQVGQGAVVVIKVLLVVMDGGMAGVRGGRVGAAMHSWGGSDDCIIVKGRA